MGRDEMGKPLLVAGAGDGEKLAVEQPAPRPRQPAAAKVSLKAFRCSSSVFDKVPSGSKIRAASIVPQLRRRPGPQPRQTHNTLISLRNIGFGRAATIPLSVHLTFLPCYFGQGGSPHGTIIDSEEGDAAGCREQGGSAASERAGNGQGARERRRGVPAAWPSNTETDSPVRRSPVRVGKHRQRDPVRAAQSHTPPRRRWGQDASACLFKFARASQYLSILEIHRYVAYILA